MNETISQRDFIFKLVIELRQEYLNSKMPCAPWPPLVCTIRRWACDKLQ